MDAVPTFQLRKAGATSDSQTLLEGLDWDVGAGQVTVLMGPVGAGKSLLLRLLAGRPGLDVQLQGSWRSEVPTESAAATDPAQWGRGTAWIPQLRHAPAGVLDPERLEEALVHLDSAFESAAAVILLDEPTRGLPDEEIANVARRLRAHANAEGTAVIITHDMRFAREVADACALLIDGRFHAVGSAASFFDEPIDDVVASFVERGAYAPPPPPPPALPRHFSWIVPGQLAGMGRPGLLGDADDDLYSIAVHGVSLLVSTTERPTPTSMLRPYGIRGYHLPIRDMNIPSEREAMQAVGVILSAIERGEGVAIHCRAGLGRTGTILACTLVHMGRTAAAAIAELRAIRPGYLQTRGQEAFVDRFEHGLRGRVG